VLHGRLRRRHLLLRRRPVPRLDGRHAAQQAGGWHVAYGDGYLMVAADGGVFNFSDKPFVGSLRSTPPALPVANISPLPSSPFSGDNPLDEYP
jgi:hypothetical protein